MTIEKKLRRINRRLAAMEAQMKASASSFLTAELEVGELEFDEGLLERIEERLTAIMAALHIEPVHGLQQDAHGNWLTLERKLAQEQGLDAPNLREAAAAYAHNAWAGWMQYLFTQGHKAFAIGGPSNGPTFVMNADAYARWQRQMTTPYADLPESEKASDRKEADKILALLNPMGAW